MKSAPDCSVGGGKRCTVEPVCCIALRSRTQHTGPRAKRDDPPKHPSQIFFTLRHHHIISLSSSNWLRFVSEAQPRPSCTRRANHSTPLYRQAGILNVTLDRSEGLTQSWKRWRQQVQGPEGTNMPETALLKPGFQTPRCPAPCASCFSNTSARYSPWATRNRKPTPAGEPSLLTYRPLHRREGLRESVAHPSHAHATCCFCTAYSPSASSCTNLARPNVQPRRANWVAHKQTLSAERLLAFSAYSSSP